MNTLLRLIGCLLAAWPFAVRAEEPTSLPPGAVADFEWFGTLGFPDVRGCPAARVATGQWSRSGNDPPVNRFIAAFLLRHDDGAGRFSVLTVDLFTREFETTKPGTPEHEHVGYEEQSLATVADAYLTDLARPRHDEDGGLRRRFGERLSERAEVFTWAWACWRNGLDERAARFYERAAAMTSRTDDQDEKVKGPVPLREKLERDLGYAMIWRATLAFEDPKIPRTRLLEDFGRVARDYPASKHAAPARETADLLHDAGRRVPGMERILHPTIPMRARVELAVEDDVLRPRAHQRAHDADAAVLLALLQPRRPPRAAPATPASLHAARAEEYLKRHLHEIASLEEVAEHLGVGPDHLRHVFRQERGISLVLRLAALRIDRAKFLLGNTGLPLKQIATLSGFASESYFSTVFRRATRRTPAGYRRKASGGSPA